MNSFGNYLWETSLCLAGFYGIYKLFLCRDTFYLRNRIYLMGSMGVSLLLPLVHFSLLSVPVPVVNQFAWDSSEFLQPLKMARLQAVEVEKGTDWNSLLFFGYMAGAIFTFLRMWVHLQKLIKNILAYEIKKLEGLKLVHTDTDSSPYSFFNYVFYNPLAFGENEKQKILLHEAVHAKQLHSLDLIFVETVRILLWFNPFIYLYHKAFVETHEYLADQECINHGVCKIDYQKALVRNVEKQMILALTSGFNSSLTLKRIKMIKKINTPKIAQFKLFLVLPVLLVLLMSFSFERTDLFNSMNEQVSGSSEASKGNTEFSLPVKIENGVWLASAYGMRVHPISKKRKLHRGTDIAGPTGTPILAIADGVVRKVKIAVNKKSYGNLVIVDHSNGFSSLYTQLDSYVVKEGQKVRKGELIAYMGSSGISTGPHLHLELKKDGKALDPKPYLDLELLPKHK